MDIHIEYVASNTSIVCQSSDFINIIINKKQYYENQRCNAIALNCAPCTDTISYEQSTLNGSSSKFPLKIQNRILQILNGL